MSRHRERGSYDRELAYSILDEAMVAHVGLSGSDGPVVLPMTYARIGDRLYLHGAVAVILLLARLRGARRPHLTRTAATPARKTSPG